MQRVHTKCTAKTAGNENDTMLNALCKWSFVHFWLWCENKTPADKCNVRNKIISLADKDTRHSFCCCCCSQCPVYGNASNHILFITKKIKYEANSNKRTKIQANVHVGLKVSKNCATLCSQVLTHVKIRVKHLRNATFTSNYAHMTIYVQMALVGRTEFFNG